MSDVASTPIRSVRLEFDAAGCSRSGKPTRDNLSAIAMAGDDLWIGTDEGTRIERVSRIGADRYGRHASFDLAKILDLPLPDDEIDIEGLDVVGDRLWVVGSHTVTRDKPKSADDDPAEAIAQLAQTDANPNRRILACIPLACLADPTSDTCPSPARLKAGKKSSALLDLLADDEHLAPFMKLPAKENGFDIEGLAVRGEQVLLGLRGPVLRGWAIVLELRLETDGGKLRPRRLTADGPRYRKHFLHLEGCGVRDMCWSRDELLILAGPTMALDGTVRVHRWTPPNGDADSLSWPEQCPAVLQLPHGRGCDRAEGIALIAEAPSPQLLVVYDGPHERRTGDDGGVDADIFAVPG